jgi:hypothetical protein
MKIMPSGTQFPATRVYFLLGSRSLKVTGERRWPASLLSVRRVTAAVCRCADNGLMRATAEREHETAGRHIEDELLFQDRHPELAAYLSEIEGTYARCQGCPSEDLERAWRHVFHECSWCGEEFEQLRKLKLSFVG